MKVQMPPESKEWLKPVTPRLAIVHQYSAGNEPPEAHALCSARTDL